MKAFMTKDKDGKIFGYVFDNTTGPLVSAAEVEKLKPYIMHVLKGKQGLQNANSLKLVTQGDSAVLMIDSTVTNALYTHYDLINILMESLSEKLIVPQMMGTGPAIRHRPLCFTQNDNSGIEVRFEEFGDFNNFEAALSDLKAIYPEAVIAKEEKDETDDRLAASVKAALSIGLNAPGGPVTSSTSSQEKEPETPSTSMALNK